MNDFMLTVEKLSNRNLLVTTEGDSKSDLSSMHLPSQSLVSQRQQVAQAPKQGLAGTLLCEGLC